MRNIVAVIVVLAIIIIAVLVFVPTDEDQPEPLETISELSEPADATPGADHEPVATDETAGQTATVAPETPPEPAPGDEVAELAPQPAETASEPRVVPREELETAEGPAMTAPADQEVAALTEEAPASEPVGAAETVAPTFDVVRIDQSGRAVIAGRAEPGAEVAVRVDRQVVATVIADRRGEWVAIPDQPLASGPAELDLSATAGNASPVLSDSVVVIDVPDRAPRAVAAETPEPEPDVATAQEGISEVEPEPAAPATEAAVVTAAVDAAPEAEARAPIELESGAETELQLGADTAGTVGEARRPQTEALAVLMPRDGEGPIKVLQAPVSGDTADQAGFRLEIIDYDTEGNIVLSGSTTPGTTVRAYVDDDIAIGVARSAEGTWQLVPEGEVEVGRHALRVEEVSEAGTVTASFEMPFSRAAPDDIQLTSGQVIVQPGNSLWRIARRAYGRGIWFTIIYLANSDQISDPDLIYPGQVFTLPRTE